MRSRYDRDWKDTDTYTGFSPDEDKRRVYKTPKTPSEQTDRYLMRYQSFASLSPDMYRASHSQNIHSQPPHYEHLLSQFSLSDGRHNSQKHHKVNLSIRVTQHDLIQACPPTTRNVQQPFCKIPYKAPWNRLLRTMHYHPDAAKYKV